VVKSLLIHLILFKENNRENIAFLDGRFPALPQEVTISGSLLMLKTCWNLFRGTIMATYFLLCPTQLLLCFNILKKI